MAVTVRRARLPIDVNAVTTAGRIIPIRFSTRHIQGQQMIQAKLMMFARAGVALKLRIHLHYRKGCARVLGWIDVLRTGNAVLFPVSLF